MNSSNGDNNFLFGDFLNAYKNKYDTRAELYPRRR